MNKMFTSFLLFTFLINFSFGSPLAGDCPGGLVNGAQLERGRFYYECRDGNLQPKGCLTDDLKHVEIGSTMDRPHYRLRCNLGSDNLLSWDAIACVFNGAEHRADEQFDDGNNFYTCKHNGDGLKAIVSGCLDQGRRINLNEKLVQGDFVMICNTTVNNGARLMPIGCVKDGRQYNAGDSFEVGQFWYNCTRVGRERIAVKPAGCINNGKRLNDGDRAFDDGVIRECRIDPGKNEIIVTGCVQRDEKGEVVERRLGCTWVEGDEPFQYEMACKSDPATNLAKKIQVRCNYKIGGGVYNIEPGCYRIIDKSAFGCINDGSKLNLQSFQDDNAAKNAGLHSC